MQVLQQSEGTAAQRRIFFHAVDATDGITAETGLTGTGRITKNGAASAATSGSIVEIDSTNMPGRYYIELTAAELDTLGIIEFRFKAAACAEVVARGQVVPWDPYDAVRQGMTALPNANAEAAGGLFTRGTGAGQINQDANGRIDVRTAAMATDTLTAAALAADAAAEIADAVLDEDMTAHQTQGSLGQAIGDPAADTNSIYKAVVTDAAGATVGVDVVAVKAETASIQADTDDIQARLPAALVGGRMASNAEVVGDKTGYALSAAGVQAIWDALTSALTTVGTIGKLLVDNINATMSSRSSHSAADVWAVGTRRLTSLEAADLPAASCNKIADHTLRRTYANARTSSDGDAVNFRSLLGAIGKLVNKWSISGSTLTVYQEDDATSTAPGGTQAVTGTAGADPITTLDTN